MDALSTSADNSIAESFNAALKREVLQDQACWPDAATCRREVFRWLARYNTTRKPSRFSPEAIADALTHVNADILHELLPMRRPRTNPALAGTFRATQRDAVSR